MKAKFCAGALVLAFVSSTACASNLVYEPVNPGFGGNGLNSNYLLGTARAQKPEEDRADLGSDFRDDPAEQFKRQLQSRLLGDLADEVSTAIFGSENGDEEPQDSGTFTYDDIQVDFTRAGGEVDVVISNLRTGDTTQITVPTNE